MTKVPAQFSEDQAEILDGWAVAAAAHAERIRAEKADIAAHVDNRKTFGQEMTTNSPFVNTTSDVAEVITGCLVDNIND